MIVVIDNRMSDFSNSTIRYRVLENTSKSCAEYRFGRHNAHGQQMIYVLVVE